MKDIKKHINKIINMDLSYNGPYERTHIKSQTIVEIYKLAKNYGNIEDGKKMLIEMFKDSGNYAQADARFESLIEPYLNEFNKQDLEEIIKAVNSNSQIYDRRKSNRTNRKIKAALELIIPTGINYKKYPNFIANL